MRLTVGPLPPAVYWRRRMLVLAGALLALFLIVQACEVTSSPGDPAAGVGTEAPTTPPTSADAPASPGLSADSSPPGTGGTPVAGRSGSELDPDLDPNLCTDEEILVTAEASQTTFAVGDSVTFQIRIAHRADRPCHRDVGGSLRELYLVQGTGAERVWSSQDCANPTGNLVVELSGGVERTHEIAFVGLGTSECDDEEAAGPRLAPGQYTLFASLGTARSEPVPITLQ